MKKSIQTNYTDAEFRQIIRDEVTSVISDQTNRISEQKDEGFLNTEEAANFLKYKKSTIYKFVSSKYIPFHKSGRTILFKKSELLAWVEERDNAAKTYIQDPDTYIDAMDKRIAEKLQLGLAKIDSILKS